MRNTFRQIILPILLHYLPLGLETHLRQSDQLLLNQELQNENLWKLPSNLMEVSFQHRPRIHCLLQRYEEAKGPCDSPRVRRRQLHEVPSRKGDKAKEATVCGKKH